MAAQGGPHGEEAVRIMVEYFSPRKAPPGFSNHSNGNAVDFMTIQGGITYTANTSQRVGWRKTWLHAWLLEHANQYGFRPLQSEEWHWDFR
jgi:LAS superfamily LD-carboxypeptidase LdcB